MSCQTGIAIVGMDCVFPDAPDLNAFYNNLMNGKNSVRTVPQHRLNSILQCNPEFGQSSPGGPEQFVLRGGFLPPGIRFDPLSYQVMPQIVAQGDPDQFLMLMIVDRALKDSGIRLNETLRERTDLIVGRGGYITNQMSEVFLREDLKTRILPFLDSVCKELSTKDRDRIRARLDECCGESKPDSVSTCIPNLVASRTANRLDLRGAAYTVDAACASSLIAVEQAIERLQNGVSDLAIAAGIHLVQTPTFWSIFSTLGALSPSGKLSPFDQHADGLVIGEGAGAVVLMRLDDAIDRQLPVYAVIKGLGIANDGNDRALLTPSSDGQVRALQNAFANAGVDPDSIGDLEAHGTGMPMGDRTEAETLARVFPNRNGLPTTPLGSVKSMIGHTMPAAGMASIIKSALALNQRVHFPSIHCRDPLSSLADSRFFVNRKLRPWINDGRKHPRRAGINAFGFGGVNVHAILEEPFHAIPGKSHSKPIRSEPDKERIAQKPRCTRPLWKHHLLLLTAANPEELAKQIDQALGELAEMRATEPADLLDYCHQWYRKRIASARSRLAIVASSVDDLLHRLQACKTGLGDGAENRDLGDDIYFSPHVPAIRPMIAGIFPGLGFPGLIGKHPDHLLETCLLFPEVREVFDSLQHRDEHPDDKLPLDLILSPPDSWPKQDIEWIRQRIAPIIVSLDETSTNCDPVAEHPSQRNLAAAGITVSNWSSWKILQALGIPLDRACGQSQGELAAMCAANMIDFEKIVPRFWIDRKQDYAGTGCLAFATCSEEEFWDWSYGLDDVSIAVHVAPEMLIAGGPVEQLEQFIQRAKEHKRIANLLPYPPIHTPRLKALRQFATTEIATSLELRPAEFPVHSTVTMKPFPANEDQVLELMLSNIDSPVRFWQSIHKLYDLGARIFIQVGGGSMAANIRTVLPAPDTLATAVDVENRSPLEQILHLCGLLFTQGVDPDLSVLFESAKPLGWRSNAPVDPSVLVELRFDWSPLGMESGDDQTDRQNPPVNYASPARRDTSAKNEAAAVASPGDSTSPRVPVSDNLLAFVGEYELAKDGESVTNRIRIDLDQHLYLHDHAVVDAESRKPVENRLPVMPLAMSLEILCQTASLLRTSQPQRLVGIENVQAQRWIDFPDTNHVDLVIRAQKIPSAEDNVLRVLARIHQGATEVASATICFAADWSTENIASLPELQTCRPWPLDVDECYTERHMFHGERFRSLHELSLLADNGLKGSVLVRPLDELLCHGQRVWSWLTHPSAMDGLLQLCGMWAIVHGFYVLPASIKRIRFFRSMPAAGSILTVRTAVEKVDRDKRLFEASQQVLDDQGRLVMFVENLGEWIFDYTPEFQDTQRLPRHFMVSSPLSHDDPAVFRVSRNSFRHANLDWVARLYLSQDEYEHLHSLTTPNRKWSWLMGRIAAKDAIRNLLRSGNQDRSMPHPATLNILKTEPGQPIATWSQTATHPEPLPRISIAHSAQHAIAIASEQPCGIDLEEFGAAASVPEYFLNPTERQLLRDPAEPDLETAAWCVKEAVAKKVGTGLQGRPADFEIIERNGANWLVRYRIDQSLHPVVVHRWKDSYWIARSNLITV